MEGIDEEYVIRTLSKAAGIEDKIREDVEIVPPSEGRTVVSTDTMVQSADIPPGMGLADAARKSVVACVSDFAAKGVRPTHAVTSVTLPESVTRKDVRDIASGMRRACREFGLSILGGDTGSGREIVLSVFMLGSAQGIVPRGGAGEGDAVYVTGPFGYTPIGLNLVIRGVGPSDAMERRAVSKMLRPVPPLEFCLKNAPRFTSATDSSDGLSTSLHYMAAISKKRFAIDRLPVRQEVAERAPDWDGLLEIVFNGGEEYETVFTVRPGHEEEVVRSAREFKVPLIRIGHVEGGSGVFMEEGGQRIEDRGWKHSM